MVRNETPKKIKCSIAYNKNSKFMRKDRYKPYNCETVTKKRAPNTKNALPLYATALFDELTSSVPGRVVQIDTLYLSTLPKKSFFAIGRPQLDARNWTKQSSHTALYNCLEGYNCSVPLEQFPSK